MSFTVRLYVLLTMMAICGAGLSLANRSEPVEIQLPPPNPYYINDGNAQFTPGCEWRLQDEAAAMKAHKADLEARQARRSQY